jgi:iron(III) transport system ATP-binding protein
MNLSLTVEAVTKSFATTERSRVLALDSIDLQLKQGEFCVLVGDSGSGKTTLMRIIAGLERPDAGEITLRGSTVFSSKRAVFVPSQARKIGMVFQSYAIWPHLTVAENVGLPLKTGLNKIDRVEAVKRITQALEIVGLTKLADRPAPALSGGQQQRVALARALAVSTDILIMDEPMSNLDARLREEVRKQIKDVTGRFGTTVLYVTHDQSEAMALADDIVIVRSGKIIAKGTPEELYAKAGMRRVADFFGPVNYFEGHSLGDDRFRSHRFGELIVRELPTDQSATLIGIRANDTLVADAAGSNRVQGTVVDEVYQGDHSLLTLDVTGQQILAESKKRHRVGEHVWVEFPSEFLRWFVD